MNQLRRQLIEWAFFSILYLTAFWIAVIYQAKWMGLILWGITGAVLFTVIFYFIYSGIKAVSMEKPFDPEKEAIGK